MNSSSVSCPSCKANEVKSNRVYVAKTNESYTTFSCKCGHSWRRGGSSEYKPIVLGDRKSRMAVVRMNRG